MNAPFAPTPDGLAALHRDLAQTRALPGLDCWRRLARDAAEPNVFFTPEMLLPALAHFDASGEVELFCAWKPTRADTEDAPRLIGLVPLVTSARYRGLPLRHLSVWRHNHSFLGTPLISKGYEEEFWQQLLTFGDKTGRAPFVRVEKLHANGPVAGALRAVTVRQNRHCNTTSVAHRALLESDLDPQAYLARSTRSKKRKELRRMMNRLRDIGEITFTRDRATNDLEPWLDEFLALEGSGWKRREGTAISCTPDEVLFLRQAMAACAENGMLERLDMRLDGRPLAMLINLLSAPGAFGFKTAYDEDLSRYSPGVQLQIANFEILNDPAIDWIDSCAAENHPMIDHLWAERRRNRLVQHRLGRKPAAFGGGGLGIGREGGAALVRARHCKGLSLMNTMTDIRSVFDTTAREQFARLYPEQPGMLSHGLAADSRLELAALADLAEALPAASVEYNAGNLPTGIRPQDVPANGLTIAETIRTIDSAQSWAVLKNVEQHPAYASLLKDLLDELAPTIKPTTGDLLRPQAYIFISSPDAVTPFHFDPEHNILLQLRGTKTMVTFPPGDPAFAPDAEHERYHRGGHRNLDWDEQFQAGGTAQVLEPGSAVYVPVMAPHFVRNGPATSISLSITWRSRWSMDEANARALNGWLREHGLSPHATKRFPHGNGAKSLTWRLLRRMLST